jgi:hypothetical protein
MGNRNLWIFAFIAVILVVLTAVVTVLVVQRQNSRVEPTPTIDPNTVLTAAAETADVRLTEIILTTPSSTPVPPTFTPDVTQTLMAQTAEAQLTLVGQASNTPAFTATATPAPTVSSADQALFVSDVTIPDGTDLQPGVSFTKTWRLSNAGTSTWTTSYSLVFISGDRMGDVSSVKLEEEIAPGKQVDISVDLVAPASTGHYRGYWKMLNAAGQFFEDSVYVDIDVVAEGAATAEPTSTPSSGNGDLITDLTMSVDESSYSGACPHGLTFSASFTVNEASTLTYKLDAGSDTPGFEFNLPAAQSASFGVGTYTLSFPLEFSSSVSGWIRLHFTGPVDVKSDKVNFTLTCK